VEKAPCCNDDIENSSRDASKGGEFDDALVGQSWHSSRLAFVLSIEKKNEENI